MSDLFNLDDYQTTWMDFYKEGDPIPKRSDLTNCVVIYWGGQKDDVTRNEFILRDTGKRPLREILPDVLQAIKSNGVRGVNYYVDKFPVKYSAYLEYQKFKLHQEKNMDRVVEHGEYGV